MEIECYHFGEFGALNMNIGRIESFLIKNPDTKFKIRTFEDYYRLMSHVFPDGFQLIETKKHNDLGRYGHHNPIERKLKKLYPIGVNLMEFLAHKGYGGRFRTPIKFITPILSKEKKQCDKKFISMCARKRRHDKYRNLKEEDYLKIAEMFKKRGYEVIFHGLPEETYSIPGYYFCSDIIESIFYLNNSELLLSPPSGFIQFASNCNCNVVAVVTERTGTERFIWYNPFDKINKCVRLGEIGSLLNPIML